MALSKKRKEQLRADAPVVLAIYRQACQRWSRPAVDSDLTRIWDMRCIMGLHRQLPFGSGMACQNLGEVLWVASEVCGLGNREGEAPFYEEVRKG